MVRERRQNSTIYTGKSTWTNNETGEVIEADEVIKKTDRNGFMITYLTAIVDLLDVLGNKKMQVVKYILAHMDKSTNTLIITTSELASKSNTSRQTVSDTLKTLQNAKIITRKTGAIMIHPDLVHKGSIDKQRLLLARFREWDHTPAEPIINEIEQDPDDVEIDID